MPAWRSTARTGRAAGPVSASEGGTPEGGIPTYSQPIAVPPGVAGMAPNLDLYCSGGGSNGPAGPGWSVQVAVGSDTLPGVLPSTTGVAVWANLTPAWTSCANPALQLRRQDWTVWLSELKTNIRTDFIFWVKKCSGLRKFLLAMHPLRLVAGSCARWVWYSQWAYKLK
jgi:hypothetical protein